ncbi:MAG TPA: hypothetical protein VFP87_08090 [Chitinophagaceae bacterium]|nr:hypothetical protein [Chitinophagaceae bacterium]
MTHHDATNLQPNRRGRVWILSGELGATHRPVAYTSFLLTTGVGIRFIRSGKHFTELSFCQGILRTVYEGDDYQVQADGNIKQRTFFGRTYDMTVFSYSQNWSVSKRNTWFAQVKPSLRAQYPYNSFLKLHFSLQAGMSYRLKDMTVHAPTIKHSS